ncbi:MAG: hypothetical protein JWO78_676, partial [Micavibrio sp.]|nr:hypothetical protein [Micavibrio sp.]
MNFNSIEGKNAVHKAIGEGIRHDFSNEVQSFLKAAKLPEAPEFKLAPQNASSEPVYFLTGASFTLYDEAKHGKEATHAFFKKGDALYLMNNTSAILQRLLNDNCRVLLHTRSGVEFTRGLIDDPRVHVIEGDLGEPEILQSAYNSLAAMSAEKPISEVSMVLYQSFAQNSGEPFKPMHREPVEEVERAANRRLRFVYNMAAMGYDLLMNRGMEDLKIISLSALAANRASYGLMADAADKVMNELAWKTFHLEANASTGKPVSIYQINAGITTACDTYRDPRAMNVVMRESVADGFPMDDAVLTGEAHIPQLSASDIAWVSDQLLRTAEGDNPNAGMTPEIKTTLYGGFTPAELKKRFLAALEASDDTLVLNTDNLLPEHILTPGTVYGAL